MLDLCTIQMKEIGYFSQTGLKYSKKEHVISQYPTDTDVMKFPAYRE